MEIDTKKIYKDIVWILAIGLGVALVAFMVLFIPIIGLIIVCVPVPYALLIFKRGIWQGIIAMTLTALIYALLVHVYVGIAFLMMIPITLALIGLLKLHNSTYEKISFLSGATLISMMAMMAVVTQLLGQNPISYLTQAMLSFADEHVDLFKDAFAVYAQIGLIESTLTENEMLKTLQVTVEKMMVYVPIILIVFSFISSSVNLYVCRPILRKFNKAEKIPALSAFCDWTLPKGTSGGFLLLFVFSFLTMGINQSVGTAVFTTVSSLFVFVFSVQGLSVIDCFLKYKGLNQFVRIILLGLAVIVFNMVLYIVGIVDQFINLRKKIQQNSHVL